MREEDFIKAIRFREQPASYGYTLMTAEIGIGVSMTVDNSGAMIGDVRKIVKAKLTEMLLRHIYEDRSRELYIALRDVQMASPMHGQEYFEACDRLVAVAKRQPPAWVKAGEEEP